MPPLLSPIEPSLGLRWSRFAQRLLAARPPLADEVDAAPIAGWSAADMRAFLSARHGLDPATLGTALRELRARVMLRIAARDLAGLAPLAEVTGTMSDLAEVALAAALRAHRTRMEAEHGAPTGRRVGAQELLVVGLGKLGGRELNVSSDIDLVFAYPDEGETARGLSTDEFFVKLARGSSAPSPT